MRHIVTIKGTKPNSKKIKATKRIWIPKTQRQIKSLLELLGYYKKFIAKIVKPLTKRLKKGKKLLLTKKIEKLVDVSKDFQPATDSSNFAIGSILSQNGHPISYAYKILRKKITPQSKKNCQL